MLDRDQLAHEYIKLIITKLDSVIPKKVIEIGFAMADLFLEEAQKRKNVERPAVIGDGWISVYEQTPPNMVSVLTISNKNTVKIGSHDGLYWDFDSTSRHKQTVTHWQPLPQAPK